MTEMPNRLDLTHLHIEIEFVTGFSFEGVLTLLLLRIDGIFCN